MNWTPIAETPPTQQKLKFMVWGDDWRHPAVAAFDPETGEFFDPESYATHHGPTHWMVLPDPPRRLRGATTPGTTSGTTDPAVA